MPTTTPKAAPFGCEARACVCGHRTGWFVAHATAITCAICRREISADHRTHVAADVIQRETE